MAAVEMDAFDQQLRLLRFMRNPRHQHFFEKAEDGFSTNNYTAMEIGLRYGDPHYFSPPICDLIKGAADQLRTPWVLAREWVPAPQGFFWYAKSPSSFALPSDDPHAAGLGATPLRGFCWTIFRMQSQRERADGVRELTFDVQRAGGGSLETADGIIVHWFVEGRDRSIVPCGFSTWRFGTDHLSLATKEATTHGFDTTSLPFEYGSSDASTLATSFQFIKQKLLSRATGRRLDRDARRWVQPADEIRHDPIVRVIELRRRQRAGYVAPEEHADVDWSCQWLVRGFWREQYYPSLQAHQTIFIAPYVKGPEDKPLKVNSATLYAVTH